MADFWYSKYSPKTIDEMVLEKETKEFLNTIIETNKGQNLLLWGNPGSGKSTIANILTKTMKCRTKFVACGLNRGVDFMTGEVMQFVRSASNVPKFVILDEFAGDTGQKGGMSTEAMRASKSVFDEAEKCNTYFIITSNGIDKIPDAIISRCKVFHFQAFPRRQAENFCVDILEKEEIKYERAEIRTAVKSCYPDMRALIGLLERSSHSGVLKLQDIEVFKYAWNDLEELIKAADFKKAYDFLFQFTDFVPMYQWLIEWSHGLDKNKQAAIGISVGTWAGQSIDPRIYAYACFCDIVKIMKGK